MDRDTRDVYGHVVAEDPFGDVIVVPFLDVLRDIQYIYAPNQVSIASASDVASVLAPGAYDVYPKDASKTIAAEEPYYDSSSRAPSMRALEQPLDIPSGKMIGHEPSPSTKIDWAPPPEPIDLKGLQSTAETPLQRITGARPASTEQFENYKRWWGE